MSIVVCFVRVELNWKRIEAKANIIFNLMSETKRTKFDITFSLKLEYSTIFPTLICFNKDDLISFSKSPHLALKIDFIINANFECVCIYSSHNLVFNKYTNSLQENIFKNLLCMFLYLFNITLCVEWTHYNGLIHSNNNCSAFILHF